MSEVKLSTTTTSSEEISPYKELALAARRLLCSAERHPILKLLLLVDPLHAFEDTGIILSKRARKLLRRNHPELSYGNNELYEGVRSGSVLLSWIEKIEFGHTWSMDQVDLNIKKELEI